MHIKDAPLLQTYARSPIVFVKGEGCTLYDDNGKEYLDCLAGIAVVSVGHSNPIVAEAVAKQAKTLTHVSNLFWTRPMAELAEQLRASAGGWGRVFFANSGAEANECAIKIVRKWAGPARYKIICAEGSFHGRTLATLAATGQPAKWKGFDPLPQGFMHVPFNNLEAFAAAIDSTTAAMMVEPIQGERGVLPATKEFLEGLRILCDKHNLALVFDEIQCGMGRTGNWWGFQSYGVKPDIFTSAKALANGLPMGACIAEEPIASAFAPGDHGTTFGGGAVVAAAALATLEVIEKEKLLQRAIQSGEYFKSLLMKIPHIKEVRGLGLMLGAVLDAEKSVEICKLALEKGLIVNAVLPDVIRFTPPLIISRSEIEQACSIIEQSVTQVLAR